MNIDEQCYHFVFILFVTGRGEEKHLPKMFGSIANSGLCSFVVKEFIGQRKPITSQKRTARMVGTGKVVTDKDFAKFAPARRYISASSCNRILFIDDLEESSRHEVDEKFARYRTVLNTVLGEHKERAAVHFLVNMLEAYFFAHPDAVNIALELEPPLEPYDGDVETIIHPKNRLKKIVPAYNEVDSAGSILEYLDLDEVLSEPKACAFLRTCIKWVVDELRSYPDPATFKNQNFDERFHLQVGTLSQTTMSQ
ncbi:MAG: hypothetical protein ACPG8W_20855 [Candidatus Promineifilaceae bacterium]